MLIETIASVWKKMLANGNSVQQSFWSPITLGVRPDVASTLGILPCSANGLSLLPSGGTVPDGVYASAGTPPGQLAQNRVQLLPFSDAQAGQQFSVRLWGFSQHSTDNPIWLPLFLAELLCTTASIPGVTGTTATDPTGFSFPPSQNLCDTISLTQGTLGATGEINSTGPGTNIPAWVTVELKGSQWFFLDFQGLDATGTPPAVTVGMNAFFKFV